jgi:hypothetical protein
MPTVAAPDAERQQTPRDLVTLFCNSYQDQRLPLAAILMQRHSLIGTDRDEAPSVGPAT